MTELRELETSAVVSSQTGFHAHSLRFDRRTGGPPTRTLETFTTAGGVANSSWVAVLRNASTNELVRLQIPLRVDIATDPDDGGTIIFVPFLRCSGSGDSLVDAIADLSHTIFFLRRDLTRADQELSEDAIELRNRLLSVLP